MPTLEALQRQMRSAEDLQSVVKTMKALAAVSIRQYERAAEALAVYPRTVELGLHVVLLHLEAWHTQQHLERIDLLHCQHLAGAALCLRTVHLLTLTPAGLAIRLAARQGAEKNIEDRLAALQGQFRQQRQMAITEELLDIVAGFEALTQATHEWSVRYAVGGPMTDPASALPSVMFLMGATIVGGKLLQACFERLGLPALVGYLVLGFLLRLAATHGGFHSTAFQEIYAFLGRLGIVVLLFRVGLGSNIRGLVQQMGRASVLWLGNVCVSGVLGYVMASRLLGLGLLTSLIIATALTATSVGIVVGIWQEARALHSPNGELLLDVAELDDISGVVLLALLVGVLPVLENGAESNVLTVFLHTLLGFGLKLLGFGVACVLFAIYVEPPLSRCVRQLESPPDPMLLVTGIGILIAAGTELLGFSVAIGAFFAGLAFSRDPQTVKMEVSFEPIYALLSPFFFVSIGLHLDPGTLTAAVGMGAVLLIAAVLGKILGTSGPALLSMAWPGALILGVSMVPRAEIAMIMLQKGLQLGDGAVPPEVFATMILVCAVTSLATPLVLHPMLRRWPQT